jgi:hypothetical protein
VSNLDIFKGNALVNSDLFASLLDMNKKMAGGSGAAGKRISIRGGKFRLLVDGEQVSVSKSDAMNMVILNAADVARTYYEGAFDPENPAPPKCWSADTRAPAAEVPEEDRMASRCADCPMNVKGSGQGESRACRFSQRLAVALEGELDTVYQLQLPATSLFGEGKGNDMGLQAYIKFLSAHNTPAIAVMTEMRFDEDANTPKLYFRPVRGLEEDELKVALEGRDSEDATKALAFTVGSTDKVAPKAEAKDEPKAEKPKASKPKAAKAEVEESDDEVEEPKKVSKTKAEAPEPKTANKLASIIDGWDD